MLECNDNNPKGEWIIYNNKKPRERWGVSFLSYKPVLELIIKVALQKGIKTHIIRSF